MRGLGSGTGKGLGRLGQVTVEYILILSFSAIIAIGFFKAINRGFDSGILFFGAELEKDLKTGRMPNGSWVETP